MRTIGHPPKGDISGEQDSMRRLGHRHIVGVSGIQESVKTAKFYRGPLFAPA